ncbi:MAG: YdcF family protein [Alphaproteobacteria bacterium]|nr:YdcF family protein [Alphaproteobacteria bacterium]
MFFTLSKILVPLQSPSDLLLLILILGMICTWFASWRRLGILLVSGATIALLLTILLPVSAWLSGPLEDRFPRPVVLPQHVDGIIVLGGAVDQTTTQRRGLPSLNSEAERMTEFVRLAKLYPDARLVFSGGSGLLRARAGDLNEADVAKLFFTQQGLDPARVIFENRSRNTYENVLFTKALVKPGPDQTWLLVSAAQAMPRTMGIFRKLGWPVVAISVAYKSDAPHSYYLGDNLREMDRAVHEWLGLLVYRVTGKTDALFPAPIQSK